MDQSELNGVWLHLVVEGEHIVFGMPFERTDAIEIGANKTRLPIFIQPMRKSQFGDPDIVRFDFVTDQFVLAVEEG